MTVRIGEIGWDSATITAAHSSDEDGSTVTFVGQVPASSVTELQFVVDQLTNLPNPDQRHALITLDDRYSQRNGWYEIVSCSVSRSVQSGEHALVADFELTGTKMPGRSVPRIEHDYRGWLLDNGVGYADGDQRSWWAVPAGDPTYIERHGPSGGTWTTRKTEDGDLDFWYDSVAAFDATLYSAVDHDRALVGSARLEMDLDPNGAHDWRRVPGRNAPNWPDRWRLNNGGVRVVRSADAAATFDVEWWDGDAGTPAWVCATTFTLFSATYSDLTHCTSSSPRRVSHELTVVQTTWVTDSLDSLGLLTVDLLLRRGSRYVTGILKCSTASDWGIRCETADSVASSATGTDTYGMSSTTTRGDSRWWAAATQPVTVDTGAREMVLDTAADTMVFGIGCAVHLTGAAAPNTRASETDGFFAVNAETQRVRGR